ncbi:MAG: hypothetical protein HeimC3_39010 [Candidatus Heimdallarchaeota archaeon LC_3]|nr:MAG: hypothetical protein HeimC3_39010 [Candidatus Heimdallarchaeota archaeon LC_3]
MTKKPKLKSMFMISLVVLLIIFVQLNITSTFAETSNVNSVEQIGSGSPPLIVEKEVINNIIEPGQSITVKITLKNLNNNPVYDVTLSETLLQYAFEYRGLNSQKITFNSIGGKETRTIYYIIDVLIPQEGNLTLDASIVSYFFEQEGDTRIEYSSYSQEIKLRFVQDIIEENENQKNFDYVFLAVLLIMYSAVILVQSIFTRLIKRN